MSIFAGVAALNATYRPQLLNGPEHRPLVTEKRRLHVNGGQKQLIAEKLVVGSQQSLLANLSRRVL